MTVAALVAFVVLAAAGTLGRFELGKLRRPWGWVPVGTLATNLTGAFAAGLVVGSNPSAGVEVATVIGGLGAFTTMSTLVAEVTGLAGVGRRLAAGAYLTVSVVGAVTAAWVGLAVVS